MKPSAIVIFACLIASVQFSCGGKESSEKGETETASLDNIAKTSDPDAKGGNTCLLDYSEKLDQLFPVQLAADFTKLPAAEAKADYSKVMKNPSYHSIKYAWKSDRKRSLKELGIDMEVAVDNKLELHGIRAMSLNGFKMSYRVPTEKELKESERALDAAFEGKSGNKDINEKLKKLDEMKVDKKTQKSAAADIGDALAKVTKAYRDVSGIGEAASWNSVEKRLYVLDNGVEISLSVDLSDEDVVNREKAIALMRQVLAKCD